MEDFVQIVEHVVSHSIADTIYLIPFLFATYVAMEWLEHKTAGRTQKAIKNAGTTGPIIGAILGVMVQCGFSAAAATFYAGRVITLGTLYAVFLSTSDEMIPIFLAEKVPINTILMIVGSKVVIGMVFGLVIDVVMRITRKNNEEFRIHELCEVAECGCSGNCKTCSRHPELVYEHTDDCSYDCDHSHHHHDHSHDGDFGWGALFKSALIHTFQVVIFVFIVTFILNALLEVVGEDALTAILGGDSPASVMVAGLVGLIPNCAASVLIAQLYVQGVLGPGAMLAGLLVSAGVGLLVLVRTNRRWKQNIAIIIGLWAMGVVCGIVCASLNIVF